MPVEDVPVPAANEAFDGGNEAFEVEDEEFVVGKEAFLKGNKAFPVEDKALLVNQAGGYIQMGLLTAAENVTMALKMLPNLTTNVSLPILSQLYGDGKNNAYTNVLRKLLKLYILGGVALVVPVCVFSKLIMSLFGAEFAGGAWILVIMAAATFLSILSSVVGQAINSSGKA